VIEIAIVQGPVQRPFRQGNREFFIFTTLKTQCRRQEDSSRAQHRIPDKFPSRDHSKKIKVSGHLIRISIYEKNPVAKTSPAFYLMRIGEKITFIGMRWKDGHPVLTAGR
jgi:hypothetical protein